ncbi:peroxidase [Daphnia magna]|uniref:peroxidase n=1 Tax=Daphnia magna TaxID=35525 RepID=UPI001E1BD010|nr:peroxidase [Daphnia magna]
MFSRWVIAGAFLMGLLLTVIANETEETQTEASKEGVRTERQYHFRRPPSSNRNPSPPLDFFRKDDDPVQYDTSGLGFEIPKPESFHYHFRPGYHPEQSKSPVSNKPAPYAQPKASYHVSHGPEPLKPGVPPRLPYRDADKPPYYPGYTEEKPSYKPEKPYTAGAAPYPENPSKYDDKYPYYCPKVGGYESECRPPKDCAIWYDIVASTPGTSCKLPDGYSGICCPDLPYNARDGVALKQARKTVKVEKKCIDLYSVNAAARAGRFQIRLMDETEKLLRANNIIVRPSSSQSTHLLFFQTTAESRQLSRGALTGVETVIELGKRFELTPEEAGFGLTHFNLRDTILSDTCPSDPTCDQKTIRSPFRMLDGSCNNIKRPSWGRSRTQFQRALVPAYADGVWLPRRAQNGGELPSPRLVSISVVLDVDAPHEMDTTWVMQYGQFVDHDLTSTPVFRMTANGMGIQCCTEEGKLLNNTEFLHPECFAIEIPSDDPFFAKFGQRCMSFVRSTPAPRFDCSFGHGEQMNQLTHFLDNSNVYGSDDTEAAALRTFENGALKVTPQKGHHELDLLPPDNDPEMNCTLPKAVSGVEAPKHIKCFKAGDARSNEHPNLAVTHTIFMREHNRLVTELAYLNPFWDDERLYQEARRILVAQTQHITYNEWLPIVIGVPKMQELGLLPLQHGFSDDYDDSINPTILNEFGAAAFRFGHTLIQGKQDLINHRRKKEAHILLREHFFKSQVIYTPGNLDKFLIGLATQPGQDFDNYFTEEITNHLFEEHGKGFGMDLVALNLQRGRDHGLPGYNAYRALCGLPRAQHFRDLLDVISPAILERFELLYDSVDDIDLFIGGVSERKAEGALLGPTFQCIVADQFLRLKKGDRFFYDLGGQPGSFTEEQLYEIRQTSFARLICDNSHVLDTQPLVFKLESATNRIVDCDSLAIPRVNLHPWQEGYEKPYTRPYDAPYKKN